jgi:hypothetical protein
VAGSLDRIAEHAGRSRSDVVEAIIMGLDSEDQNMAATTTVIGAPTAKRNLRLSTEALTRLKELAGDLELADFLRRTLAYVVAMAPPEWHLRPAEGDSHEPASPQAHRRIDTDHTEDFETAAAVHAGSVGLGLLVVVLVGTIVALIIWFVSRNIAPPVPGPADDSGGQHPSGPVTDAA